MARLIVILAALSCALAGCEGHGEGSAGKAGTGAALHVENLGVKEGALCLSNFDSGLAACNPAIIGQRRYVLIRNVILPAGK